MKNLKTINLRRALLLLLAAVMLITMLPLAGMAGPANGRQSSVNPFAVFAASYPTSGEAGDNAKWSFSKRTGTLTISGSGEMWDWDDPTEDSAEYVAPWLYYMEEIKTINIQSGISGIGCYTFTACTALTGVSIPGTVKYIGEGAFLTCTSLKSISIPSSVTEIDELAFALCIELQNIKVSANVTNLGSTSFFGCASADRIEVASGNPNYKTVDGVLYSKDGKTLLTYPCGKQDLIYNLPASTKRIAEYAFAYSQYVRLVNIPEGVTEIADGAFFGAEKMFRIFIPASMENIREEAFDECQKLQDVYYASDDGARAMMNISYSANDPLLNAEWHYSSNAADMLVAPFEDVPKGKWYEEHVIWAAVNNITQGTSAITFGPDIRCNRAHMVTFLWRAAGEPQPKSLKTSFKDVPTDAYYSKAVAWAVENGITQGTSADEFSPTAGVKRGDTVTFLYRWSKDTWTPAEDPEFTNPFKDITGREYYAVPVFWAVKNEITKGKEAPDLFNPSDFCTRAEIVTFIHRAMKDRG